MVNKIYHTISESLKNRSSQLDVVTLNVYFEILLSLEKKSIRLDDNEKIEIEKCKLSIMSALKNLLLKINQMKVCLDENTRKPKYHHRILSSIYAVLGTGLATMSRYFGCLSIVSIFMVATNPVAIAISAGVAAIAGLFFILKDVRKLRKSLGISFFKLKSLFQLYQQQAEIIDQIHDLSFTSHSLRTLRSNDYISHNHIMRNFHDDLSQKNKAITSAYKESFIRKAIKGGMIGLDALLAAGSGFILGKSIILLIPIVVAANPIVGLALCASIALFSFVAFCVLKYREVTKVVDTVAGDPKKLKEGQIKLLHADGGISKFTQQITLTIENKTQHEANEIQLKSKIKFLEDKLIKTSGLKTNPCGKKKTKSINSKIYRENKIEPTITIKVKGSTARIRNGLFFTHKNKSINSTFKTPPLFKK